jgi:hypothetical protein
MSVPDPVLSKLIGQCLAEIHRLAYLFAGEEDDVVEAALATMRDELEDTVPAATVDQLLETIMKCKVVIEQRGLVGSVRRH